VLSVFAIDKIINVMLNEYLKLVFLFFDIAVCNGELSALTSCKILFASVLLVMSALLLRRRAGLLFIAFQLGSGLER
jgi:hypothetical protein